MNIVSYDGSWFGFFTAVFEIYEYQITEPYIAGAEVTPGSLFAATHLCHTNEEKALRVIKKLQQKLTPKAFQQLYKTFLSEEKEIENVMYRYARYVIDSQRTVENDYSNADVLMLQQVSRKVHREKHRMEAFVRFQLTKDQLYYAIVQPDFNVLPLIAKHFKSRYADQRWLIYDARRNYGIYSDMETVIEVSIDFSQDLQNETAIAAIYDDNETIYQSLWQKYFSAVNIAARKNTKLHIRHMPKRYWKYLVEKQA